MENEEIIKQINGSLSSKKQNYQKVVKVAVDILNSRVIKATYAFK